MCISTAEAALSSTKICSFERENGRVYLAYSNKAINYSGKKNAMILPIPGKLNKDWFYDTSGYSDFLEKIVRQTYFNPFLNLRSINKSVEVFALGMYQVGISSSIDEIKQFAESNEISIKDQLYDFFQEQYTGWSFVICVFDSEKTMNSQPIAFEYEPFEKEYIYFPTMDSHTGDAPNLNEDVILDHSIIFEAIDKYKKLVDFGDLEVPEFIKNQYYRTEKYNGTKLVNGDFYMKKSDLPNLVAHNAYPLYRHAKHPAFEKILNK